MRFEATYVCADTVKIRPNSCQSQ